MNPTLPGAAPANNAALLAILQWLATAGTARGVSDVGLFEGVCLQLCRAVVPLWRSALQLENLHPLYYGYCLHWYDGRSAYEVARSHAFGQSAEFAASPYLVAQRSGGSYRCRLEAGAPVELPLLRDLRESGATDFLAETVVNGSSLPPGVSWATRRPGGFSARDIAMLRALTPYLGLVFGSLAGQRKVEAVLRTYLGAGPGREVAEGKVRRGDIRRIEAVVLLTDLRGFTRKAAELPEPDLLEALNDYFGCVAEAVSAGGGDILKFMGDGVLSCFPVADQAELPVRCRDAVGAVRLARAALQPVNARREAAGRQRLDFVAVMDAGSLSYGNIGAADRLDFTVVGPAVNIASRIETLAKELGEETLVTAAIADHLLDLQPRKVASRVLRGLSEPVAVYALD